MYIIQRNNKFLNERYQWGDIPHTFPEWQFVDVLPLAMNYPDPPQQIGEVMADGTIEFTEVKDLLS
jgi:hypothetical protein